MVVTEGLEGGRSRLSTTSSKRTTQWLLWLVTWLRCPMASLCGLQHNMREKLWCSLRRLGVAVLARVEVLDEDKEAAWHATGRSRGCAESSGSVWHEDGDGSGSGRRSVIWHSTAKRTARQLVDDAALSCKVCGGRRPQRTVVAWLWLLSTTASAASRDDGERLWDWRRSDVAVWHARIASVAHAASDRWAVPNRGRRVVFMRARARGNCTR
jgi:hypothetical protein